MKRILVTGGAGFIGSHTVDRLLAGGYEVRILDNLEPPTHLHGLPDYVAPEAEFIRGDVRNLDDLSRALRGVHGVIHLAATGGFTPDQVRYLENNSIGTANLLEVIQRERPPVEKLVVASSVGIYGEGKYRCAACGVKTPSCRPIEQLERADWEPRCPGCDAALEPLAIDEDKVPYPQNAYSISKFDQERLVLSFGRSFGIPARALRFFLTYGPRQSLTNPYTGVISIFSSRILNGLAPILFEDGNQLRDFVYVEDVARANVLALELDEPRWASLNVGTGVPSHIGDVARQLAELLGRPEVKAELPGAYRPGEARHVFADIERIRSLGFRPSCSLREGLERYLEWVQGQGEVGEYFSQAMRGLRSSGVVRERRPSPEGAGPGSLTLVFLAYNEAGNLEPVVRDAVAEASALLDDFEVVIVNDGSRDATPELAERLAAEDPRIRVVHHPFNAGYGAAQKSGIRAARKEWVIVLPADRQFDAKDLGRYLEAREGFDIVGSNRIGRQDSWSRRFVSDLYNNYMRRVHDIELPDLNWVKMYRRSIFSGFEIETRGFGVDAEMVMKARHLGARITSIDVPHYGRTWGEETGISFRNIWNTVKELRRIPGMVRRMDAARRGEEST